MIRPPVLMMMRSESVDSNIVAQRELGGMQNGGSNSPGHNHRAAARTSRDLDPDQDVELNFTSESFRGFLSIRVESRRKYALAVAILDVILGLGQLIYHINRATYFFANPTDHVGKYEHLSWASYFIWTLTFFISTLQISMAVCLISASYSKSSIDLSRSRIRKCSLWVITSQLLLTILIIKVIIFTASSQLKFELGVFYVFLEDPTSIWFVLIFYSLQIVFRGFAIYLIKKYIQYLE